MPAFCLRDKLGILDLESRFCREVFFSLQMAAIFLGRDKEKFSGQAGSCWIRNHRRKHYQLLDDSSDVGSKHGGMNLMTHWDFLFFSSCICESLIVRKNPSGIINTSTSLPTFIGWTKCSLEAFCCCSSKRKVFFCTCFLNYATLPRRTANLERQEL